MSILRNTSAVRTGAAALLLALATGCATRGGDATSLQAAGSQPTGARPGQPDSLNAAHYSATLVPVGVSEDPETFTPETPLYLNDCVNLGRRCLNLLQSSPGDRPLLRAERANAAVGTLIERLREIDDALPSDPSQWTWTPATPSGRAESDEFREKFLLDPPLKGASAIALSCQRSRAEVSSAKVIDSRGAVSVFPIEKQLSSREKKPVVVPLYYPAEISTILLNFADPGQTDSRVTVWGGVTHTPEYAKEAIYWLMLAQQELARPQLVEACKDLQQAIVKIHLYRKSRNRL